MPDAATQRLAALGAANEPIIVAGSTWPSDEQVLEEAWRQVRSHVPAARLVIAPHETTDAHLAAIEVIHFKPLDIQRVPRAGMAGERHVRIPLAVEIAGRGIGDGQRRERHHDHDDGGNRR